MSIPSDAMFVERLHEYFQARSMIDSKVIAKYSPEQAVKLFLELNLTQNKFKWLLSNLHDHSVFPSFYSIQKILKAQATGHYEYTSILMSTDQCNETINGCFVVDIESILKERITDLLASQNLVYKKTIASNGQEIYFINYCITGDSGQDSTKFNLQPQLIKTNHSSLALSIIAFWFGKDTRCLMEFFLKRPMAEMDRINQNGFDIMINEKMAKWVNNPTLGEICFAMIGRADIEGSKSNVDMDSWLPQASYPCGNFSGTSF
uniref:CRAL-TRIO domain-containing protein n=1 Tax=Rhabditophanes sp. KR3021 TaxID=114890 RepID=A0AC35TXA5_9BILA